MPKTSTSRLSSAPNILRDIVERNREALEARQRNYTLADWKIRARDAEPPRGFRRALTEGGVRIIAEIKRASPSQGLIRERFQPVELAQGFARNGAAAISILTEPFFFRGRSEFISVVREAAPLPLLRKDFLFDPYQLYEARALGADAILLIVAILSGSLLAELLGIAAELEMDALVEVHDEEELACALAAGAQLVGINNRNLRDFSVDLEVSERLSRLLPAGITPVGESGIKNRQYINRLQSCGIHAFLIGETLMRQEDPGAGLKTLLNQDS